MEGSGCPGRPRQEIRVAVKSRGGGPEGKLYQVFEKAIRLPRYQQNKAAEFVEAFVNQHVNEKTT